MSFLPVDYEAPKSNSFYMRLQDGENRLRILTRPVMGWEDWRDKKPIRFRMDAKPDKPVDPTKPIKHFWAFVVWNCIAEEIQILEITQATLRRSLETLIKDADWGNPFGYDIKIVKTGELVNTKYAINPVPHREIDRFIVNAFNERRCNLNALFDGKDPFADGQLNYTPLAITSPSDAVKQSVAPKSVTAEMLALLEQKFLQCDPAYRNDLMATLARFEPEVTDIKKIPLDFYDKIKNAVDKKWDEFNNNNQLPF